MRRPIRVLALLCFVFAVRPAAAQLTVPGQDWDGSLVITSDTTIDLALAVDGPWNVQPTDPSWAPGVGVYDATQWAVVFHFTDVQIDAGARLDFANHPSEAPVIWLVSGTVDVQGSIDLEGADGSFDGYPTSPGPGGFRGGNGSSLGLPDGGGYGPGGGNPGFGAHGSYGTQGNNGGPTYGNEALIPLIGGSGGGGANASGGAGGGAILVASEGAVTIDGEIIALGGRSAAGVGRGAGGGIRIVADEILGSGSLRATGGDASAGIGRIRLEYVTTLPVLGDVTPAASVASLTPGSTAKIFPDASDPLLRIVSLNGVAVPADPEATLAFPWQDVAIDGGGGSVTVVLEGTNVPANATVNVVVVRLGGARDAPLGAAFQSSAGSLSTWEVTLNGIDNGISAIQARAVLP